MKKKCKVINLFGGPGTGKSTTAAGLFHRLKLGGVNCEYVQEYAKDKAWEHAKSGMTPKVLQAQEYVFAKQHFRMRRCAEDVDLIITDSPLMMGIEYIPDDFPMPSLRDCIIEAHMMYDNFNVFLKRVKEYNPNGRFQTAEEAEQLDAAILRLLMGTQDVRFVSVHAGHTAPVDIINLSKGWLPT